MVKTKVPHLGTRHTSVHPHIGTEWKVPHIGTDISLYTIWTVLWDNHISVQATRLMSRLPVFFSIDRELSTNRRLRLNSTLAIRRRSYFLLFTREGRVESGSRWTGIRFLPILQYSYYFPYMQTKEEKMGNLYSKCIFSLIYIGNLVVIIYAHIFLSFSKKKIKSYILKGYALKNITRYIVVSML